MKNSKTKPIDDWFAKKMKDNPTRKAGAMPFIAIRDKVADGLEAGYTKTVLFEYFKETKQLSCCFETFLRYIKKYIENAPVNNHEPNIATTVISTVQQEPITTPKNEEKSFKWDPVPKPDELY